MVRVTKGTTPVQDIGATAVIKGTTVVINPGQAAKAVKETTMVKEVNHIIKAVIMVREISRITKVVTTIRIISSRARGVTITKEISSSSVRGNNSNPGTDRKSTRLNSSHPLSSRMPSSA